MHIRIGFFGGSFDPPHLGHLAVARRAADEFSLDRVLLAPVANQPLKPAGPVAPFADRLALVELLCAGDPRLAASDLDAALPARQPNYTIDTLARLRSNSPPDVQIFSIIGADAFANFRSWRSPDALLNAAEWIVVARPGALPDAIIAALNFSPAETARVHTINDVQEPASATFVRERLREGDPCQDWLPPALLQYIREHHLYGT
jgi:nicotinate-nucleotide adenylyltransferase